MAALWKLPYNALFGRRRQLLTSQRSPPPTQTHFHNSRYIGQPGYPGHTSRWGSRYVAFVLRNFRRPIVIVLLLGVVIWLVRIAQDRRILPTATVTVVRVPYGSGGGAMHLTITQTEVVTQTEFVRATQTILAPGAVSTGDVSGIEMARDVFGFPIIPSSPADVKLPASDSRVDDLSSSSPHAYRADGLIEVSPAGPHPIFELIEQAEKKWEEKNKRASKTLKQACAEYQRRYGRRPPKGFEVWWTYMQVHSVPLPDEYDQIDRDLSPFYGIDPVFLGQVQRDWEAHVDSYTIGKDHMDNTLTILNHTTTDNEAIRYEISKGANLVLDIVAEVETHLRPFRAVFSPHDNPTLHSDWELREEARIAGKAGKYIDMVKTREHKLHGWRSSCPPFSPAWVDPVPYTQYPPPLSDLSLLKHTSPLSQSPAGSTPKTFIHDHRLSMDPCLHPAHLLTHGEFLAHGPGPVPHRTLIPQFGYSPSTLHDDIMTALPMNWVDDVHPREDDPPFAEKLDSRLHWRGRNTGLWHGDDDDVFWSEEKRLGVTNPSSEEVVRYEGRLWWLGQRGRLVDWANKVWEDVIPRPGPNGLKDKRSGAIVEVETGIPVQMRLGNETIPVLLQKDGYPRMKSATSRVLQSTPNVLWAVGEQSPEVPKTKWAPAMADVAYVGEPINCDGMMCERLRDVYEFRNVHDGKMQGRYKYVMDVDGNGWSSRFKRLITSNALIFKTTVYPEWFTDRVAPWVHYIPIQVDLSDLLDTLYFFRGDPSGNNAHDDLAEKIAIQGREWSKTHWRREDMTAYMFRLFLEYARVLNVERDVKIDAEVAADLLLEGEHPTGEGTSAGKVAVKVGKEDYVYREEDEYVKEEDEGTVAGMSKPWDWKHNKKGDGEEGPRRKKVQPWVYQKKAEAGHF